MTAPWERSTPLTSREFLTFMELNAKSSPTLKRGSKRAPPEATKLKPVFVWSAVTPTGNENPAPTSNVKCLGTSWARDGTVRTTLIKAESKIRLIVSSWYESYEDETSAVI